MTATAFLGFFVLPAALFVLMYFPAVAQLSWGLVSPYPKADVWKRVYAASVDSLLVATSWILYRNLESWSFLAAGAAYLLVRDAVRGRSVGKLVFGLVVINLETGRPANLWSSVRRNFLLLIPGANVAAIFLEAFTIARDVQGQRLGDRLAQTQVVEGFGVQDLVDAFQQWWRGILPDLARAGRPKRGPVVVDP